METSTEVKKLPQNLQKYLENVIKKEGYLSYKVDTQPVDARGVSFLSNAYTVAVKGETKDGGKETQIFVKGIISTITTDKIFNLQQAYAAEAFVYNELSCLCEELQDEAGIPARERFKFIRSYGESSAEGILLENVVVQGYKSFDRTYKMSVEIAEMAIKELAKFHALSFVIKVKRPEYFEKKIKTAKHPTHFGPNWNACVEHIARIAARHVKGVAREKLENFLPKYAAKWTEHQLDQTSVGSCLCHGDFRLGNLLARHTDKKVEDMYVVDYQLISFGCPVNDLLFFIFVGTDQEFRRQHLDHLVGFYYTSLKQFLKKFDLNLEDFYPRKEFLKDYKEKLDYGLIVALYFLPFFWADDEAIPDLSKQDLNEVDIAVLEDFPEMIQGIVDDYMEWGRL